METKLHRHFDVDGNELPSTTIQVSDGELEMERAEKAVAELSVLPDAELTTTKLRKLVKALARLRR